MWLDGKFLPKGSVLVVNVLGLQHDDSKFPEPESFNPARWTGQTGLSAEYARLADYEKRDHYVFGTGRRLCAGIHFAERSLFITFAKIMWAFDIRPGKDENGNEAKIDVDLHTGYEEGIIIEPIPFKCDIQPRSERRKQVIMEELALVKANIFPKYEVPKA